MPIVTKPTIPWRILSFVRRFSSNGSTATSSATGSPRPAQRGIPQREVGCHADAAALGRAHTGGTVRHPVRLRLLRTQPLQVLPSLSGGRADGHLPHFSGTVAVLRKVPEKRSVSCTFSKVHENISMFPEAYFYPIGTKTHAPTAPMPSASCAPTPAGTASGGWNRPSPHRKTRSWAHCSKPLTAPCGRATTTAMH